MNLHEYLRRTKIKVPDFAKLIGYTPVTVYMILRGAKKPSKRFAMLVEISTKGQVAMKDIMSPDRGKTPEFPVSVLDNISDEVEEHA